MSDCEVTERVLVRVFDLAASHGPASDIFSVSPPISLSNCCMSQPLSFTWKRSASGMLLSWKGHQSKLCQRRSGTDARRKVLFSKQCRNVWEIEPHLHGKERRCEECQRSKASLRWMRWKWKTSNVGRRRIDANPSWNARERTLRRPMRSYLEKSETSWRTFCSALEKKRSVSGRLHGTRGTNGDTAGAY